MGLTGWKRQLSTAPAADRGGAIHQTGGRVCTCQARQACSLGPLLPLHSGWSARLQRCGIHGRARPFPPATGTPCHRRWRTAGTYCRGSSQGLGQGRGLRGGQELRSQRRTEQGCGGGRRARRAAPGTPVMRPACRSSTRSSRGGSAAEATYTLPSWPPKASKSQDRRANFTTLKGWRGRKGRGRGSACARDGVSQHGWKGAEPVGGPRQHAFSLRCVAAPGLRL